MESLLLLVTREEEACRTTLRETGLMGGGCWCC